MAASRRRKARKTWQLLGSRLLASLSQAAVRQELRVTWISCANCPFPEWATLETGCHQRALMLLQVTGIASSLMTLEATDLQSVPILPPAPEHGVVLLLS